MKTIKTLQWNIGGAIIRSASSDPNMDESYCEDGLDYIEEIIKSNNPDIITLQETHTNNTFCQAEEIAKKLGYFFVNDVYDHSHLEEGQELGQAILSKFDFESHSFEFFYNPKIRIEQPSGEVWVSHNKGFTNCQITINKSKVNIGTAHFVPFSRFGLDPASQKGQFLISDIESKLSVNEPTFLIQGDFNLDDITVEKFFSNNFMQKINEVKINNPTTPKGKRLDHILYKRMRFNSLQILSDVLTDHFPLVAEFEIG